MGKVDRLHGIRAGAARLERIPRTHRRLGEFHDHLPERTLHEQGARCMDCGVPFCHTGTLIERHGLGLPDQQPDPRVERPRLPRPVARGARSAAQDEQLPRVHRPRLPRAVRGFVRPRHQRAAGDDQEHRVRDRRPRASRRAGSRPSRRATRTGKKVAVVGSGPAGLAAAAQLNSAGHTVTVFERADRIGGLLMYGIPNMKLDKTQSSSAASSCWRPRASSFVTSVEVGKETIRPTKLLEEFDAIVLCGGATSARDLPVAGREPEGHPLRDGVPARQHARACSTASSRDGALHLRQGQGRHRHRRRRHRHRLRRDVDAPRLQEPGAVRDPAAGRRTSAPPTTRGRSGPRSTSWTTARRRRRRCSATTRAPTGP